MTNEEPTLVGGRYELGELLGRGGMAEVRKGTDTRLGRIVAVKLLRTDLASDATFQARFRREAQSSASLNHPSIVAVYDTGEEMNDEGIAQPYIVMEYVAGRTLRDILREGRKILPERALEMTAGVLAGLDYSHRAGIIHRDIKPANVMLTPSGDIKVMDFGIARAVSDASNTMTQTAAVVGTAQYLSPEQARGETVDSRSDVYSTGCLLYELLTGRPPFVGDSPVAVAYQHVREPAMAPSTHDSELTPEVDSIVMKALTKRLDQRYQSAAAMRSDIERYLAGRPVQAPAVDAAPASETAYLPAEGAAAGTSTGTTPVAAEDEEEKRSRKGLWTLLGVLLIALLAAAAFAIPKLMGGDDVEQVQVPRVAGEPQKAARATLEDAKFEVEVEREASEDVARGRVIRTDPGADDFIDTGSMVTMIVSTGKPDLEVPNVIGMDQSAATETLEKDDFNVIVEERDTDDPAGEVVDQRPGANTSVSNGSDVTIYVSDGPEKIPNVVDMMEGPATQAIEDAGFKVKVVSSSDTTKRKGMVIDQSPAAGEAQEQGTTVTIVVSSYEKPDKEPTDEPTDETSEPSEPTDPTETASDPTLPTDETTP